MSKKSIKATWDWDALENDVDNAESNDDGQGNLTKSVFLGTVFAILPSGRYMSGTTEDERFWADLEAVASEYNMSVESGEGDPCDIFLVKQIEQDSLIREESCTNGN